MSAPQGAGWKPVRGNLVKCPHCDMAAFPFGVELQGYVRLHPGGRFAQPTLPNSLCHFVRKCGTQLEVVLVAKTLEHAS